MLRALSRRVGSFGSRVGSRSDSPPRIGANAARSGSGPIAGGASTPTTSRLRPLTLIPRPMSQSASRPPASSSARRCPSTITGAECMTSLGVKKRPARTSIEVKSARLAVLNVRSAVARRSRYSTGAFPVSVSAYCATPGTSFFARSASSAVSTGYPLSGTVRPATVVLVRGVMATSWTLLSRAMSARAQRSTPSVIENAATSAATPMMTPVAESVVRVGLVRKESAPTRADSLRADRFRLKGRGRRRIVSYTTQPGLCWLRQRVDAGRFGPGIAPHVHPGSTANRKHQRDDLRSGEGTEQETVILVTHELDEEPLDTRQQAVQPEQPSFRVLVIAQAPEDQKHHEAERDFVELSRMDGENLVWRRVERWRNVKQLGHVGDGRRWCSIGKAHRPRSVERPAIIIADCPASGTTDRVGCRYRRRRDVADAREAQMLATDHEVADEYAAGQSAPEHETGSAQKRAEIVHQDRVVDLSAEQSTDHRGKDDVADWLGVMAATSELPLRDDLSDDERQQHRQSEAGELERTDIVRERLLHYRSENPLHWGESRPLPD